MPHSSGGSSSGGGFHGGSSYSHSSSGSSSSSGPTSSQKYKSISRVPTSGTRHYIYYNNGHYDHCYSKYDPRTIQKPVSRKKARAQMIILSAIGVLLILLGCYSIIKNPRPISTRGIDTSILIDDTCGCVDDAAAIKKCFENFRDETGITPALITVDDSWRERYNSLETFAYDRYVKSFSDESHWLIVYSLYPIGDGEAFRWAFEGMQGDDTDKILKERYANQFTVALDGALRRSEIDGKPQLSTALNTAFTETKEDMMAKGIETDNIMVLIFLAVMGFIFIYAGIKSYRTNENAIMYSNSVEIKPDVKIIEDKCDYCGGTYVVGTIHGTCPYCGAPLAAHDSNGNRV